MLLASAAIVALGTPAAPARAERDTPAQRDDTPTGVGIQLLEIPVARAADPRARAYIIDHVKPGTTIQRRVELRNTSPTSQHVELYAGAAAVEKNAFTISDGRTGNELTSWVSMDSTAMQLPSGDSRPAQVTIAVPKTASKGERYGVIWAQVSSPTEGGNVAQIHRVGIRIYLDIGPGGEPPTDFRIDSMSAEGGAHPTIVAHVTNTGGRATDMTGTLSMSKGAVRAGPFKVTNGTTLLPGQSGRVEVAISEDLADGMWDAKLTLVSGMVTRTFDGRVSLPVAGAVVPISASTPRRLILLLAGIAVVALALFAWYLVRRGRRRSGGGPRLA